MDLYFFLPNIFPKMLRPDKNQATCVPDTRNKHVTQRRVRITTVVMVKSTNITYSECVSVAFGIQQAMSMRRTTICGLAGSNVFFLSHKRMCFLFSVQLFFLEIFLILRTIYRARSGAVD